MKSEKLPKCRCDKYLRAKGYHSNGCKYAEAHNMKVIERLNAEIEKNRLNN